MNIDNYNLYMRDMPVFSSIMVANRGEIAVRIIRTARKMGITAIALHTPDERDALHARVADRSWELNGSMPPAAWLDFEQIISLAKKAKAGAIHPGYGFLSENSDFAAACESEGLVFIGPRSETIGLMGDKIRARETALKAGLPVIEALTGTSAELIRKGGDMKYPLLVKAVAGGGGRGMRLVSHPGELSGAVESAGREALAYFGNGSVYLEQFLESPRHIEVQVLGDNHGNIIHLYDRECSVQRRYQKIIEEAPSPYPDQELRLEMARAASTLARSIGYTGAGTVEFLADRHGNFYFLEMNTRIQVEHPVTEIVTGIDIVEEQIRVAAGRKLRYSQDMVKISGHAIECRLYAEDPAAGFLPSPGMITCYHEPEGENIRVDSALDSASLVSGSYDPLLAKVTASGDSREEARKRLVGALENYCIQGIKTNAGFLLSLLHNGDFIAADFSTGWCETSTAEILNGENRLKAAAPWQVAAAGALVASLNHKAGKNSLWEKLGYWRTDRQLEFDFENETVTASLLHLSSETFRLILDGTETTGEYRLEKSRIKIWSDGIFHQVFFPGNGKELNKVSFRGFEYSFSRKDLPDSEEPMTSLREASSPPPGAVFSPLPGRVIKVTRKEGDTVKKGEILVVVESMKMETGIEAPADGVVGRLDINEGQLTDGTLPLLILEPLSR
jgi:3-methylcrotonyl-CoA carboxylase alpha subunit